MTGPGAWCPQHMWMWSSSERTVDGGYVCFPMPRLVVAAVCACVRADELYVKQFCCVQPSACRCDVHRPVEYRTVPLVNIFILHMRPQV